MNKKGFTLVEMIAVIVLLGVLLMIAVPTYNTFIKKARDTKKDADASVIEDATKSLINDCIVNKAPTGMKSYCTSFKSGITINGTNITSYLQALKDNKYLNDDAIIEGVESIQVIYDSTNYDYSVTVSIPSAQELPESDDSSYTVPSSSGETTEPVTPPGGSTTTPSAPSSGTSEFDLQTVDKKTLNVGDLVKFKTEKFYVIKNDGSTLSLFAKSLLNVGPCINDDFIEGRQSSYIGSTRSDNGTVTNYASTSSSCKNTNYGEVYFSSSSYWLGSDGKYLDGYSDGSFVYNENSLLKPYVDGYVSYLNGIGFSNIENGTLLSIDDVDRLCNYCGSLYYPSKCPSYLFNNSYWLGSVKSGFIDVFLSEKRYGYSNPTVSKKGVRPVINVRIS